MFIAPEYRDKKSVNTLDSIKLLSNTKDFDFNFSSSKVDKYLDENYEGFKPKNIKCTKCPGSSFTDHKDLKLHYKTEWHDYNIKQSSQSKPYVTLSEFDDLVLMNIHKD